ncbi:uncharacterized protein G2W53_018477 [Senna tora]|uniref:Uncharacterized protein n=1 Tax=Senna tora TaxID=362788 RepID=A0A834WNE2_9FABA|nr:uncharacterized protein G2W53_018477 [Senna tora]
MNKEEEPSKVALAAKWKYCIEGKKERCCVHAIRTRIHLWVPFVEVAIVSVVREQLFRPPELRRTQVDAFGDDCDFFYWIDLPSMDAKDIAIGRLRVKISTLNGTVRRLQMVNRALLVSTLILVAAVCILLFLVVKYKFEGFDLYEG